MKRVLSLTLLIIIVSSVLILPVAANSAPMERTFATPATDSFIIDGNSPIEVLKEDLIFDFKGDKINTDNGLFLNNIGMVSATYTMHNPTNEDITVPMFFPYVNSGAKLLTDYLSVSVDNKPEEFKQYPLLTYSQNISTDDILASAREIFEPKNLASQISTDIFIPESFKNANFYKYEIIAEKTTSKNEYVRANIDFNFASPGSKIILASNTHIASDDFDMAWHATAERGSQQSFDFWVIGEDLNGITFYPKINRDGTYTDDDRAVSFTYEKTEVNQEDVTEAMLQSYTHRFKEYNDDIVDIPHYQLQFANLFFKDIDNLLKNHNIIDPDTLNYSSYEKNIITALLYDVDFAANQTLTLEVCYPIAGESGSYRNIKDTTLDFYYFLRPAQYWSSFKDLTITVYPPESHPYLIDSNLKWDKSDGVYTAKIDSLPKKDLKLVFNESEETALQEIHFQLYAKRIRGLFSRLGVDTYGLTIFAIVFVLPILVIIIVVVLLVLIVRKFARR